MEKTLIRVIIQKYTLECCRTMKGYANGKYGKKSLLNYVKEVVDKKSMHIRKLLLQ